MEARAQLAQFLSRFDEGVRADAVRTLEWMRTITPGAMERVYDAYNALSIGFGIGDSLRETFVHVAVYPKHVNLGFNRGAELDDPRELLVGSGALIRHVRVDGEILEDPYVGDLVRAAAWRMGFAPKDEPGELKIVAIYARQRPRRPAKRVSTDGRRTRREPSDRRGTRPRKK